MNDSSHDGAQYQLSYNPKILIYCVYKSKFEKNL